MGIYQYKNVDAVHNKNILPLSFEDDLFDIVITKHIFEYIESSPAFMKEIHRVSKPGGKVIIETPHFTSLDSSSDLTHYCTFRLTLLINLLKVRI